MKKWKCNYIYLTGDYSKVGIFSSKHVGTDYGYDFFKNNCLHYVKDALKFVNPDLLMNCTIIPSRFKIYREEQKRILSLNLHYVKTLEESSNVLNQMLHK